MKNASRIAFSTLAGLTLVTTLWAIPQAATTHSTATAQQTAAQTQSVSGKITAASKDSFTLTVAPRPTATAGQQSQQQPDSTKTMSFLIDKNTTVEGEIKVNANADVTYRQDNGTNVAISVHVTP